MCKKFIQMSLLDGHVSYYHIAVTAAKGLIKLNVWIPTTIVCKCDCKYISII